MGACALGPLVTIDDVYHGNMTVNKTAKVIGIMRGESAIDTDDEEGQ